jgi:GMP synthase-like glutamine amidotransferase
MNAHVFQHVDFEGIGSMATWLSQKRARVTYTLFYEVPHLPDIEKIDLLIVMGGPMSVTDEQKYPWLKQEKEFIRQAIERGLPVIGVCLGAQLIASALGARVFANEHKEIGWLPVRAVHNENSTFSFPEQTTVFHWHGETFDLPDNATQLAYSVACKNQAFQINRNVIGLQFHLETTPKTADLIIQNCRGELVSGMYTHTELALRAAPPSFYAEANHLMDKVLAYVTRPLK